MPGIVFLFLASFAGGFVGFFAITTPVSFWVRLRRKLPHWSIPRPAAPPVVLDANWLAVRSMERAVYGHCYHRLDGTTNALGWEPISDADEGVCPPLYRSPSPPRMIGRISGSDAGEAERSRVARLVQEGIAELDESGAYTDALSVEDISAALGDFDFRRAWSESKPPRPPLYFPVSWE